MSETAGRLLEIALTSGARAGATRIVAIDGRSGSGKSKLAAEVARRAGAPTIPMEQLYGRWDGLRAGIERLVSEILAPLAAGSAPQVPHYDWVAERWLAASRLTPPELLVLEGVGAGALAAAPHLSALASIELPEGIRRSRAMARDGSIYQGHWEDWSAQEEQYISCDRTPQRADLVVRGEREP